jgi:subtilase family serine protease
VAPATGGLATTLANYAAIVSQDRAQVVSSSYGYCEPVMVQGHVNVARIEATIFEEMAAQGQSMMAASGDAGSEACLQQLPPPSARPSQLASPGYYQLALGDPAGQSYVTAVGGTSITRLASPPAQTTWNQSGPRHSGTGWPAPFDGAGGRPRGYPGNWVGSGGISMFWPMPFWQQGFDTSGNSSGQPCGAAVGSYCREVPDVSALAACCAAAALPGYAVYGTAGGFQVKGWQPGGGTSLATPLWAALTALADQRVAGHRLGLLSPALDQIDRQDPAAFTDVTRGNNNYLAASGRPSNFTCSYDGAGHQPCYEATPGYDMATGLGSPVARQLAADLAALR